MLGKMCFCKQLREQFPFIVKVDRHDYVKCTVCMTEFSIANRGRDSIIRHIGTSKHQKAVNMATSSLKLAVT